ncbi:MAG: motility protein A [Planctomycetaceae bacterium]|jgi:chemotaxis protein MotA|nr:motility protein A [Planctomycetaceae bacterium]
MDLGTIIGCALGTGLIVVSILLGGMDKLILFWDLPSVLMVFGGGTASVMIAYPMKSVLKTFKYFKHAVINKENNPLATITQLVSLAETARREGLLALENRMDEIDDLFLKGGIRMAVDGMSPEVVESIMNTEIDAVSGRHNYGRSIIANYGKYFPAFGMIGTLVGLVLMLADLNPDTIGAGMAVALLTTLYGAIASNLYVLPMADKIGFLNDAEIQVMEITLKGVLSIQAGENPRVIKQKLLTYVTPSERPEEEEGA